MKFTRKILSAIYGGAAIYKALLLVHYHNYELCRVKI